MNDEDLRDLFAGLAMQGLLAEKGDSLLNSNGEKYVAEYFFGNGYLLLVHRLLS